VKSTCHPVVTHQVNSLQADGITMDVEIA
jgi:hypothetical protein